MMPAVSINRRNQARNAVAQPAQSKFTTSVMRHHRQSLISGVLSQSNYDVLGGVLYHLQANKTTQVSLTEVDQKIIPGDVHIGPFGSHSRKMEAQS